MVILGQEIVMYITQQIKGIFLIENQRINYSIIVNILFINIRLCINLNAPDKHISTSICKTINIIGTAPTAVLPEKYVISRPFCQ